MNNQEAIEKMIQVVEEIERENHREKFDSDKSYKASTVNRILDELDKVISDED